MRISAAVLATALGCRVATEPVPARSMAEFETQLDALRAKYHVAGLSAAIAKDQGVAWEKGFGLADVATNRGIIDSTVFHLASLTKPFAATVVLQLVEEGKVSLDDPVAKYGISLPQSQGTILVRHLLSHTSEGVPGTQYRYNGNRYSLLDSVIARADGRSTAAAIRARIVQPLKLGWTRANIAAPGALPATSGYIAMVAAGYTWNGSSYTPTAYPTSFSAAAGLMSTAREYAEFSLAIDHDALLKPETRALAFTPARAPDGHEFPYGLGWFSTMYNGERVIWHYGYWTANSSLIVKVPSRGLSFVLLANTDGLSAPFPLGSGQLERSDFARLFLDAFLSKAPPPLP